MIQVEGIVKAGEVSGTVKAGAVSSSVPRLFVTTFDGARGLSFGGIARHVPANEPIIFSRIDTATTAGLETPAFNFA